MHKCVRPALQSLGNDKLHTLSPTALYGTTVLLSRFSSDTTSTVKRQHLAREKRRELVVSFVERYMASHEGEFPMLSVVRKEVGGAYAILKEVWHDLARVQKLKTNQVVSDMREQSKGLISDTCNVDTVENKISMDAIPDRIIQALADSEERKCSLFIENTDVSKTVSAFNVTEMPRKREVAETKKSDNLLLQGQMGESMEKSTMPDKAGIGVQSSLSVLTDEVQTAHKVSMGFSKVESLHEMGETALLKSQAESKDETNISSVGTAPIKQDVVVPLPGENRSDNGIKTMYSAIDEAKGEELLKDSSVDGRLFHLLKKNVADTHSSSPKHNGLTEVSTISNNANETGEVRSREEHLSSSEYETDDDHDIAAPEYKQKTSNWRERRKRLRKSKFRLFLKDIPSSVTESDLHKMLNDCGEIIDAQIFPRRFLRHSRYGLISFKTEAGLVAARSKSKLITNGVEVKVDSENTKEPEVKGDSLLSATYNDASNTDEIHKMNEVGADRKPLSSTLHDTEPCKAVKACRGSTVDHKKHFNVLCHDAKAEYDFGVLLADIPSTVDVSDIEFSLSQYIEAVAMKRKSGPSDRYTYAIQSKTKTPEVNPLGSEFVVLNNHRYRVLLATRLNAAVVRLFNLPSETTERDIRSSCEFEGQVLSIEPRGNGVFDVHFAVKCLPNLQNVLARLGKITLEEKADSSNTALRSLCDSNQSKLDKRTLEIKRGDLVDRLYAIGNQMKLHLEDLSNLMQIKMQALGQSSKSNKHRVYH